MTFSRFPEEKKPEPKKEEPPDVRFPQTPPEAKKPDEPTTHKVERKPEPKKVEAKKPEPKKEEEKAAPARKTRTTVLRDIVEDLEGGDNISDEMRADLQELNRRLTRALAS